MGYIGQAPANKVVKTADIEDSAVTAAKIAADTVTAADLGANSVDSSELVDGSVDLSHMSANSIDSDQYVDGSIDTAHIGASQVTDAKIADMAATKLTGSIADARVPASAVTQHVTAFDDTDLRSDIITLALKEAITENRVAYNLPNSMIEQFQDDSKIGSETTGDRNASEYWSTLLAGELTSEASGGNLLLKFNNNVTNSGTSSLTITNNSVEYDSHTKFGSHSATGWGNITIDDHANMEPLGVNFTLDFWHYSGGGSRHGIYAGTSDHWFGIDYHQAGTRNYNLWVSSNGTGWDLFNADGGGNGIGSITTSIDVWNHVAFVRNGDNWMSFINGVKDIDETVSGSVTNKSESKRIGKWGNGSYGMGSDDYIDDFRWTKGTARWTSNFNVNDTLNATGTLISTAQTANSAQTKVSGVILYANTSGTATLGTDLKIYFTCNGGTNWTESTPTAAGTFSSGILMAKCPEVTCTSGTDIRYKAVWANQSSGSKETRLHGIGMNY